MKKTINKIVGLLLAIMLTFSFAGCNLINPDNTEQVSADALNYVSMRINPHIEIVVDKNDTVVSVNAVNEDGEVLLLELNLVGMDLEQASELFVDKAIELGYLNLTDTDATVYINVEGEFDELVASQKQKIEEKLDKVFSDKGKFGKVCQETIDQAQLQIIERVKQMYPEMTEDEILKLSVQEVIDLIKDYKQNGSNISAGLRDEYKAEVEQLRITFMTQIDQVNAQIKELETLLRKEDKTIETYFEILEQLDELYENLEDLWDGYKDQLEALKDQYQEKEVERKDNWRLELEERKEHFKEYYDYLKGEDDDDEEDEDYFKNHFGGIFDDFKPSHHPDDQDPIGDQDNQQPNGEGGVIPGGEGDPQHVLP